MRRAITAIAVAAMLSAAGCTTPTGGDDITDNPGAGAKEQQYETLRKRADIDRITGTYQQLIKAIQQMTVERFDLPTWELGNREEITRSGCGADFPDVAVDDTETRSISGGFSRANLSDAKWPEALTAVSQLAREQGFTKGPGVLIDRPGEHVVEFYDTTLGARLDFGTKKRTTLRITTGCHLITQTAGGNDSSAPGESE